MEAGLETAASGNNVFIIPGTFLLVRAGHWPQLPGWVAGSQDSTPCADAASSTTEKLKFIALFRT